MLHAKIQDHRTSGTEEEDFKGFYHIYNIFTIYIYMTEGPNFGNK